jgi:hypothetical protein
VSPEPLAERVGIVRAGLARWFRNAALAVLALPFVLTVVHHLTKFMTVEGWHTLARILYPFSTVAALVIGAFAAGISVELVPFRESLEEDPEGLALVRGDRRRVVPRGEIVEGQVLPYGIEDRVHLTLRSGNVLVATVQKEAQAERILSAASVDAGRRRTRFRLAGPLRRALLSVFGGFASFLCLAVGAGHFMLAWPRLADLFGVSWLLLSACITVLLTRGILGREIVVGVDGIAVVDLFGRQRFIPFAEVAAVDEVRDRVLVTLKDGRVETLTREPWDLSAPQRYALVQRAQQAMALGSGAPEACAGLALLDRNGRSVSAWMDALMSLLEHPGSYREVAPSRAELLALVSDGDATAERRIAAAVALVGKSSPAEDSPRTHLRVAADACANDALRDALEHTARGDLDEETLMRALR